MITDKPLEEEPTPIGRKFLLTTQRPLLRVQSSCLDHGSVAPSGPKGPRACVLGRRGCEQKDHPAMFFLRALCRPVAQRKGPTVHVRCARNSSLLFAESSRLGDITKDFAIWLVGW